MSSANSTHSTSRDPMVDLFKELQEPLNKFSTLLITFIGTTKSDMRKSLFKEQDKMMILLILTIVLHTLVIFGTILMIYYKSLFPIIICAMLLLGGAASVLALSIISSTVAWITLTLWVGMFTVVAYDYVVPERIKNLIKEHIALVAELLPV